MSTRNITYKINADATGAKKGTAEAAKGFDGLSKQSGEFFTSLTSRMNIAGVNVGGLNRTISGLRAPLGAATTGVRGFGMALAATGIGAIVVAIGALVGAFMSTQRGADALSRVMVPLKFVFETLLGVAQKLSFLFADKLKAAFNDPKQAVVDLGNAIRQNLLNRLEGLGKQAGAVGRILSGLFKRDMDEVRAGMGDLGDAVLQTTTGIVDLGDKAKGVFAEFNREMQGAIERGRELVDLQLTLRGVELEQVQLMARLRREYNEQFNISRDTNKTEAERIIALQRVQEIAREQARQQQIVNDLKIRELELQQANNDTGIEGQMEMQRLLANRDEIEASYQAQIRRTVAELSRLTADIGGLNDVIIAGNALLVEDYEITTGLITEATDAHYDAELQRIEENKLAKMAAEDAKRKAVVDAIKAEEAMIARLIMANMAQIRTVKDVANATLDAVADAIAARIQEAAAIQFAKALASTPFPLNVAVATAAAGAIRLLTRSLFSLPGRSIRASGGGGGGGDSSMPRHTTTAPVQQLPRASGSNSDRQITDLIDGMKNIRWEIDQRHIFASFKNVADQRRDTMVARDPV